MLAFAAAALSNERNFTGRPFKHTWPCPRAQNIESGIEWQTLTKRRRPLHTLVSLLPRKVSLGAVAQFGFVWLTYNVKPLRDPKNARRSSITSSRKLKNAIKNDNMLGASNYLHSIWYITRFLGLFMNHHHHHRAAQRNAAYRHCSPRQFAAAAVTATVLHHYHECREFVDLAR